MGEPFSLVTGVAGLVKLCLEVAAISQEYVHGVRRASKDVEEFLQELSAFTCVLQQFEEALKKDEAGNACFKIASVPQTWPAKPADYAVGELGGNTFERKVTNYGLMLLIIMSSRTPKVNDTGGSLSVF
ncbi:hypothetical protein OEA41_005034 [Lepraria neglecta]|uniref:Fungal N-terminal domain-containing protein n=1 Tax=Lepraria neglecta TaxID=209136 RepID=A0AAD9YZ30_9LECA|nr:hypothetical protein OEA41_005034 [Lepraria neglecta]